MELLNISMILKMQEWTEYLNPSPPLPTHIYTIEGINDLGDFLQLLAVTLRVVHSLAELRIIVGRIHVKILSINFFYQPLEDFLNYCYN